MQTAEHLTAQSLARAPPNANPVPLEAARAADTAPVVKGDRSKSTFMEDAGVPELFRAKLQDCEFTVDSAERLPKWIRQRAYVGQAIVKLM